VKIYQNGRIQETVYQNGDTVRVQMIYMDCECDWIGEITARNESIQPGKPLYRVTGGTGWIDPVHITPTEETKEAAVFG
jgi:hypothetical protein